LGEGGEEGSCPPEGRKDKQSTLSEEGGSMEKEEEGRRRKEKSGVMKKDWRQQSEHFSGWKY
jgi:hypothetical protein